MLEYIDFEKKWKRSFFLAYLKIKFFWCLPKKRFFGCLPKKRFFAVYRKKRFFCCLPNKKFFCCFLNKIFFLLFTTVLTKLVVKSFTFRLLLYKPSRSLNDLLDSLVIPVVAAWMRVWSLVKDKESLLAVQGSISLGKYF